MASAIWSREDPLFPAHRQLGADPPFNIYYKVRYYADFKGGSLIDSLNCGTITVVPHMTLYFSPRTAVLSCIRTRVIHTHSKFCVS